MATIFENNDVEITSERVDRYETKINVNGKNMIWISAAQEEEFERELTAVLQKYMI